MVASCWLFLYDLYYDVRIHEHQVHRRIYNSPPTVPIPSQINLFQPCQQEQPVSRHVLKHGVRLSIYKSIYVAKSMKIQSSFSRGDEGPFQSSRNSRTEPYSETEISSQEYQSHFLKIHFNIILTPMPNTHRHYTVLSPSTVGY